MSVIKFAQFSDCHLFADRSALHHGVNVFDNLEKVLIKISEDKDLNFVIFTGDLTQDHSDQSYRNFTRLVNDIIPSLDVYRVLGNHDSAKQYTNFLSEQPFKQDNVIDIGEWQIQLFNSKSDTPAGIWHKSEQERYLAHADKQKHQLFVMHHHPVDLGYFIDRHGLMNKDRFYQFLSQRTKVKAIVCGHVHNAIEQKLPAVAGDVSLFTCPATSIQFDQKAQTVANAGLASGFRIFELYNDGRINTTPIFLDS